MYGSDQLRRGVKWFGLFLAAALVVGCVATEHRANMEKAHVLGASGGLAAEVAMLEKGVLTDPDEQGVRHIDPSTDVIKLLELGALYHYAGMYERSNEALEIVYAHYAPKEMLTDVNLQDTLKAGVKAVFSEGIAGAYDLSGYEKVFLHTLKALNYLMLDDLEGAMVEVRRGEYQQSRIEDELEEKRQEAEKEREENKNLFDQADPERVNRAQDSFMSKAQLTPEEKKLIAGLKDGYRNAMTYAVSATGYELTWGDEGDSVLDDAAIDLSKSFGLFPNPAVGDRYLSWALYRQRLSTASEQPVVRAIRSLYPSVFRAARHHPGEMKNVHVFLSTGDAPRVKPLILRLPNPVSATMSKVVIPRYERMPDQEYQLEIDSAGSPGLTGKELDFDALALKSFDDKLPGMYFRIITRLVVQTIIDKQLKDKLGMFGQIAAAVKNELLEQPDTRSWTALPKAIYYGAMYARGDEITVKVRGQAGQVLFNKRYPVHGDKVLLVDIRKVGDHFEDHMAALSAKFPQGSGKRHARVRMGGSRRMVRLVQARLNALGYPAGVADGQAGKKTRAAVRDFQRDNGMRVTGRIDSRLADAVAAAYRDLVRRVQTLLNGLGYDTGTPDGVPGKRTLQAVKAFQQAQGLAPTGRIDKTLLERLRQATQ